MRLKLLFFFSFRNQNIVMIIMMKMTFFMIRCLRLLMIKTGTNKDKTRLENLTDS